MKKWIKDNLGLVIKVGIIFILLIWFIVLNILKNNVEFCEAYSRTFARFLGTGLAFITNLFPISLAEVSIIITAVVVVILIVLIVKDFKKKLPFKAISHIVTILLIPIAIISGYMTTSEMQYNRKAPPIPLYEENPDKTELYSIVNYFAEDYNYCASQLKFDKNGEIIVDYRMDELNEILAKEYERLNTKEFDGYFNKFTPRCKPMMSSEIYSQLQITGVDFGLFGEANINTVQPKAGVPMVMAHEIAHTKGVMRESDANLVAMYLLLGSENPYLRFSGYYWGFYRIMELANYTGNKNDYQELDDKICYEIKLNDYHSYLYWKDHDLLGKIGDFFNNLYIKSSGDPGGTTSYNDTPTEVDEEKEIVISYSIWQRIYLHYYYSKK